MPISLHVVTSRDANERVVMNAGSGGPVNQTALRFVHLINEIQKSLSAFILGGVLERFPGLKIVSAGKRRWLVCPLCCIGLIMLKRSLERWFKSRYR